MGLNGMWIYGPREGLSGSPLLPAVGFHNVPFFELGVPTTKSAVLPNGVDVGGFDEDAANALPADFDAVDPEAHWFTYAGILNTPQGLEVILEAAAQLEKQRPELYARSQFVLVGEGPRESHLKEMRDRLGLDLAERSRDIQFAQNAEARFAFEDEVEAPVIHRLDLADPTDAADIVKRRIVPATPRLDHRNPPVACERIAHQRAVARLEHVQRQLQAGEQDRSCQREDRKAQCGSAEQDFGQATTGSDHPRVFQADCLEDLQQLGAGCALVPFAVPPHDLDEVIDGAASVTLAGEVHGKIETGLEIVRTGIHCAAQGRRAAVSP